MGKQNRFSRAHKQPRKKRLPPTVFDLPQTPFGRVVFYEKNKRLHIGKHPELGDPSFIKAAVNAIKKPDKVFYSLNYPYRDIIIYNEKGTIENPLNPADNILYTRVVLGMDGKIGVVKTAFERTYIKERKKVYPDNNGNYR